MLTVIVIVLVIYFLAMVGIGWYGRKHTENFEGYLSMGRSAGVLMLMGGAIGGHIGNGFVVGGAAEGAAIGMAGAAYGLGCAFSNIIVAFTINDFIYKGNYMSLAQYCHKRYNSNIPGTIYDLSTAISSIGLIAGQIMAGRALFEALGLNGNVGAVAIAVVVLLYSQMSGLWGALATSVVQTCVILAGLIITTLVILNQGGLDTISAAVTSGALPETFLSFKGLGTAAMIGLVTPIWLGMITDQPTFQRISSAKSAKASKIACLLASLLMIPLALMPAFIGAYGAAEFGVSGSDAFFTVILNSLPIVVCALIIAAVLAAVMSTIDCGIITMSTVLTRDIWQNALGHNPSEKQLKKITLIINILFIGVSTIAALQFNSIVGLLSSVYSFLAAACFIPFVGGALWKKGNTYGATASSIVGVAFVVATWLGLPLPMASIFPILPAAITFVIVSLATQGKDSPSIKASAS